VITDSLRSSKASCSLTGGFRERPILRADRRDSKVLDARAGPWQLVVPDDCEPLDRRVAGDILRDRSPMALQTRDVRRHADRHNQQPGSHPPSGRGLDHAGADPHPEQAERHGLFEP